MANSQGGFQASVPANAYGSTVTINASGAAKTIAQKPGVGWATTGNIVNFISNSTSYVECSITYANSIPGQSQGWKFWFAYITASGIQGQQYVSISDPTNHSLKLRLLKFNGIWQAQYDDLTIGVNGIAYTIPGSPPNVTVYTGRWSQFFMESAQTTCSNWSSLTGSSAVTFSNIKYLDSNRQEMSFTPTVSALPPSGQPTCSVGGPCLTVDVGLKKVSYHGC